MIRFAQNKDIENILKLLNEVNLIHQQGRPDLFKIGTKYTYEELAEMLKDPKHPILVDDEDGKVVAYAFLEHQQILDDNIRTDIKTLYIDDLCVDEKWRNKHIGSKLLQAINEYAQKNKFYNITLNVWALNKNAFEYYEKVGFKIQKIGMEIIL